ncbi:hypothetical protein HAX54_051130 [Datura stramonium]|uniref:JmjC domain-containing protein n=1 Tax=Datura stramonium TaxID=4076 RepID=A0ABS8WPG0_DATST|nr:hypothetical protein [Datura stramonium]
MPNKRRKSDIPVVIIDSSTSDEEEDDVDYLGDSSDDDSCGNSNNKKRKKMGISRPNQTRGGENSRKKESKMCHQCQRSDKDRVVCCSKCKAKRYCLSCITRWYPRMTEEAFLKACAVCRNLCNCIACLRLDGLAELMNVEVKFSDEEKLEYSKHIVRALLPALEQFNTEQMIEKQIEYQIQALPDSDVNIHKAEYGKDECIYCNYCSAFIVDFHRSCSSCSYDLCLTCCKELRNGNLQADASEVRMQYIDNGPGYLHGNSITSSKNGNCAGTTEVKIRDQNKVAMASKWKPKENGAIPCPPKDMGGCSKGTLNLRCIFSENWISQLLLKAKEIAQKCKLKEMNYESELHYSCSKYKGENDTSGGKLRKAAARENSDDNYVFCPAAVDTRRANLRHFRLYLSKGEPVVVTNVHDNALGLSWEPMVMWRVCRQTKSATDVLNCLNWCELEMNIRQFFKGYVEGRVDSYGWPQLLKLNDWPPSGLFDERLPRHGAEFSSCLPFMEYTHPQYGYLNLALRLPDSCSKPDLGPKAYIAYGFPMELGRGDSVSLTKLHYAVTDTVVHPILDETFYLSTDHKNRLKEEYGIEPWSFVQKLGEAVFIPAGCPHQVRNLKSCINVAVDFISPENVNECIRLTEELRKLPRNHDAREDKLGVKKIIVHAMSQAVDQLEKTLLNSEAGITTGLSSSSPISKSIHAMPKSSSVSKDPSSSKTAKRKEYVAPSEDEKPKTAEVNLHSTLPVLDRLSSANKAMSGPSMPRSSSVLEDLSSSKTAKREEYVVLSEDEKPRTAPLPVLSAIKAQESTSVPSQELKQSINIEDVESTFHTVQSFLKSLPEQDSSQQSGLQSNSTSSTLTLARLIFECSIRLPLEALAHNPMHEKEMCGAIAALNKNASSLFSDEQAKQLVKLKYEFPVMVKKWRDLAHDESSYQEFLTNFDEDRKKLDNWIRSEARLKSEYAKREEQAKELEAIIQAIKTRQKEIMDERREASQAAQKLMLSAQEKSGKIESSRTELVTTKMQMDVLRKNWSNFQSTFP